MPLAVDHDALATAEAELTPEQLKFIQDHGSGVLSDEFYSWLIYWTQELLARVSGFFDRWIIDAGAVGGSSRGTWGIGALLRLIQVGNLQAYVFLFGLGVVAIIYFAVFR